MNHIPTHLSPLTQVRSGASFTQGFVASACISAFQDVAQPKTKADVKKILRHGLQGGTALSAGCSAAAALRQRDYSRALLSAIAGAAGVMLIEKLLNESASYQEEKNHE